MEKLLDDLLSLKSEGVWWDFKLKFHDDLFDLLHDITCLANVIHDGDRFLIFGINDALEVVGLDVEELRFSQADVISYLRQQPYAEHNIPKIDIKFLKYSEKNVAILRIKNERLKPFYFTKELKCRNKILRAGAVYSRIRDTNTPKDSCANPQDTKAMWQERFGLDLPAITRFQLLLKDTDNWVYNGINGAFYALDPDFTISISEEDYRGGNFWWQNVLIEEPVKYDYLLKYKNAVMHELPVVHFQNEGLCVPFPDVEYVTHPEKRDGLDAKFYCDLFYYTKGTLSYVLFEHLRKIHTENPDLNTPIVTQKKPPIIKLPFFILDNNEQIEELCSSFLLAYKKFVENQNDIVAKSLYKGVDMDRHKLERVFSEWAFGELTGKYI
ncbi:ATP-binding protein [Vibrio splendidus]|uniref:ATP-binding protein n=1 Tax=Vibrio splendidus TaxID=29497 RepID=A0AA43FW62_VIBSP|nr:ATP-binding protein [Vibrio splendidus]MDH5920559.1 ATP-binding protein [Vibrio splendidus]